MERLPDGVDFLQYAAFCGHQESQYIVQFPDVTDRIVARLKGASSFGDHLPWQKTHDTFAFRPREITIWAGVNGGGKSLISGMTALWLMRSSRVLIASLEMPVEATAARMVRQAAGVKDVADGYVRQWAAWTRGRAWVYDQLDSVDTERIVGVIVYAARELGVDHVFVDSLAKCGIGTDDYNRQKTFVDKLAWLAKTLEIHIHLIHHIRKGDSEMRRPDKSDVKGAGEIVDLVDNLLMLWRNKPKEEKVRCGEVLDDEPDANLIVGKQRHGEWEGRISLWFHQGSMQYTPSSRNEPLPFPDHRRDLGVCNSEEQSNET